MNPDYQNLINEKSPGNFSSRDFSIRVNHRMTLSHTMIKLVIKALSWFLHRWLFAIRNLL